MVRLVAGLGNPGPRYRGTRHNVGFEIVDALAKKLEPADPWRSVGETQVGRFTGPGGDVTLMKPGDFMNLSGSALRGSRGKHWFKPQDVLVCYDDIDLPLGSLRIRLKGSAGGHRGMLSVIEALGSPEFPRLRVGVGRASDQDPAEYVLERFTPAERKLADAAVDKAVAAVLDILGRGMEAAMNAHNRRD